ISPESVAHLPAESVAHSSPEPLAHFDRNPHRPQGALQGLADDGYRWRALAIGLSECPALRDACADRVEVRGGNDVIRDGGSWAVGTIGDKRRCTHLICRDERQPGASGKSDRCKSRNHGYALPQVVLELACSGGVISLQVQAELHAEEARGIKRRR